MTDGVTVVVSCFQQAHLVRAALDSVARQSIDALQLIVTDDGSTDDSVAVIEQWLVDHPSCCSLGASLLASPVNVGLPASLNRALPHVRGEYLVVLNGDDWMDDDRLAVQMAALRTAPAHVGVSYCDLRIVDGDGVVLAEQPAPDHGGVEGDVLARMASATFIGMPGVMVRTSVLDAIGPWDESLVADDFDFLMRAASQFEFAYLPRALVNYRVVGGSLTNSRGAELAESRIRSLVKFLGRSRELDAAVLQRLEDQAVMLHGSAIDGRIARRHIRAQLRRRPTARMVRVAAESHLRLAPRTLAFRRVRRSRRTVGDAAGGRRGT